MKSCKNLKGGLQEVAEQLDLERIGPQHQAGSDSLLTGMAFFKMKEVILLVYQSIFLNFIFRCSLKTRSMTLNFQGIYMVWELLLQSMAMLIVMLMKMVKIVIHREKTLREIMIKV